MLALAGACGDRPADDPVPEPPDAEPIDAGGPKPDAAKLGTCAWHAKHTKRLLDDARFQGRLPLLDLIVADKDNMPPSAAVATAWKATIDAPGKVAIDSMIRFLRSS